MPVRVRLTRKLAKMMNGVDVSAIQEGQEIDLSEREAEVLISAGWATPGHEASTPAKEKLQRRRESASAATRAKLP
jgi:hypothetical protein